MGFEPTRAEHIGLAVQRLNHSATASDEKYNVENSNYKYRILDLLIFAKSNIYSNKTLDTGFSEYLEVFPIF